MGTARMLTRCNLGVPVFEFNAHLLLCLWARRQPRGPDGRRFLHRLQEDHPAAAGSAGVHRDPVQPEGR